MAAPRLHGNIIADRIVQLIRDNLAGPMGLKTVAVGALEFFPTLENLADQVPAVLVKPAPTTTLERITTGQTYRIVYGFRIVLVRSFGADERIVRDKTDAAERIVELLIDNVDLGGLILENAQVNSTSAKVIEHEPYEEQPLIRANLTTTSVVLVVETTSRK